MGATCRRLFMSSYDDIQHSLDCVSDNGREIFYMRLSGCKREELRVQLDDHGNLEISGKRLVCENKWIRFGENFQVHASYDLNDVRAIFEQEVLYVIIPTGGAASSSLSSSSPSSSSSSQRKLHVAENTRMRN